MVTQRVKMFASRFFAIVIGLTLGTQAIPEDILAGLQIGTGTALTIVMFHGDEGNGGDPTSNFLFGAEIARRLPDATVHVLLRPGYQDPWGRKSPGENFDRRDQYTLDNAEIIATNLKRLGNDAPIIAVGHSGGAAQLALALSLEDGLVDEAILVGCPCDLDLWQELNPAWPEDTLIRSVSPTNLDAPKLGQITVLVGEADMITPPVLSRSYIQTLTDNQVNAELTIVPGGDHSGNRALSRAWLEAIFAARARVLE